jgi:hypothetical protein
MNILTNHIGYDVRGPKRAVLCSDAPLGEAAFAVIDERGATVHESTVAPAGPVARWGRGHVGVMDFDALDASGTFELHVHLPGAVIRSMPIEVAPHRMLLPGVSDVLYYFKTQRQTGAIDRANARATFAGDRSGTVDVRGGWCDATADWSKNLSHLNFANYLNPQQAPLPVWCMLDARDALSGLEIAGIDALRRRLAEEAAWGADALVRLQDPEGYFYLNAIYSRKTRQTRVCDSTYGYGHQQRETYQAGLRQGAGVALAALARAASAGATGEFGPDRYLQVARTGWAHLAAHNAEYLDDGVENVIDDYCALLAACELNAATGEGDYLQAARRRAEGLVGRLREGHGYEGWLAADAMGDRPFFHAADEGLPIVALCRYLEIEPDAPRHAPIRGALERMLGFYRAISTDVSNPFGYARQLVREASTGAVRASFFMPHDNETTYWWQGENARLGSLATGFLTAARWVDAGEALGAPAEAWATRQLDWIAGLNPFDTCLLHGRGRNNREYVPDCPNAPGGVYNGITACPDDPEGIAFCSGPHGQDPHYTWRWVEQWVPHGAWLLLASAQLVATMYGDARS